MTTAQPPKEFSRLGLGGYPLAGGYGTVDERQARETVDAALDAGLTFIDTAEAYLDSEERLGRILKGRRDGVFLATKAFPSEPYTFANLRAALDGSLKRLQTDRIDLYQLHGPEDWLGDLGTPTALEEIAAALTQLRESGKARNIGVCNLPSETLTGLASATTLFSTQNLYNILDRGDEPDELHLPVEREIIPVARSHGLAFIAYSPFSRGLLVEGLDPARVFGPDDERHYLPRYRPGVYSEYVALADRLDEWARSNGHTLTQLALAWTLSNPGVSSTLVGAKTPRQIAAFAGADAWQLTPTELGEIDQIVTTLPDEARAAKMIVWDHFDPAAVERLRQRRSGTREAVDG